jgi:hypothetical protein
VDRAVAGSVTACQAAGMSQCWLDKSQRLRSSFMVHVVLPVQVITRSSKLSHNIS